MYEYKYVYRVFMNMCFKYFDYQTMKEVFILHYLIHIMLKTFLQYYVTNSKIEVLKNISFFFIKFSYLKSIK